MVENWAESATTVAPHTRATANSTGSGAWRRAPMTRAHEPEMAMADAVSFVRPHRSPRMPPTQQPSAPMPMTAKAMSEPSRAASVTSRPARASVAKAANHAHMA